jgi:hypothetical protein
MADEQANPNTGKLTKALTSSLKPFEEWAAAKNTPDWHLAGLVADQKWPAGREVSERQFDTALEVMLNAPLGADTLAESAGEAE